MGTRTAGRRLRALAILLALWPAAAGAEEEEERVWLGIERPGEGEVRRSAVSLMHVAGWAGSFEQGRLELAVAIDVSHSTQNGSGVDVNGDGHVGDLGWRNRRSWWGFLTRPHISSDPEDSILHAELEAVRRLVDAVDANRTRVGIVTFWEEAQVRSSIGNTRTEIDGALQFIAGSQPQGRTNIAAAIDTAVEMLLGAPDAPEDRELAILLLSDDFPTVPPPAEFAARKAIQSARNARQKRIRIYSFALGVEPGSENLDSLALREIAKVTHGAYTALAEPGEIIDALPRIDLTGLADVQIRNRTTGRDASATWVRPDGTFDGFVALRKGRNVLRVTATGPDGGQAVQDRVVFYRPKAHATDEDLRELEELKEQIRQIQVEQELLREMEARRKTRPKRDVDVEVE